MQTARTAAWLLALGGVVACGGAAQGGATQTAAPASVCGEAKAVALDEGSAAARAFGTLRGPLTASLALRCPSDVRCTLPEDRQIEVSVTPLRQVACEFAACRVPYLGSLPFALTSDDPCPRVLWSVARVSLKTDRGTLDEQVAEVNVLAGARGEVFLRFMIESPGALRDASGAGEPRTVLLDVQLEAGADRVRGQLSALAAKRPAEPAAELRFASIWSATWEVAVRH